jgi:hypothetical protein
MAEYPAKYTIANDYDPDGEMPCCPGLFSLRVWMAWIMSR